MAKGSCRARQEKKCHDENESRIIQKPESIRQNATVLRVLLVVGTSRRKSGLDAVDPAKMVDDRSCSSSEIATPFFRVPDQTRDRNDRTIGWPIDNADDHIEGGAVIVMASTVGQFTGKQFYR